MLHAFDSQHKPMLTLCCEAAALPVHAVAGSHKACCDSAEDNGLSCPHCRAGKLHAKQQEQWKGRGGQVPGRTVISGTDTHHTMSSCPSKICHHRCIQGPILTKMHLDYSLRRPVFHQSWADLQLLYEWESTHSFRELSAPYEIGHHYENSSPPPWLSNVLLWLRAQS